MRNLGMVVFSSNSGLGNQSRRLAYMLKPERILLVDNSSFSKNKEQHPEWYDNFSGFISNGIPTNIGIRKFLDGLTHLYIIENPLNWYMIELAHRMHIKTYIASNYEFCDNLNKPHLPWPDMFLMPSHWQVDEMQRRFGLNQVQYLPPPVYPEDFKAPRDYNLNRPPTAKKRILHIVGTLAAADRNGTLALLEAVKYTKTDYQLIIKTQHTLPAEYNLQDARVFYAVGNEPTLENLYHDFDFMVLPRRFGGLCLPMQEALMSALPVIMPDISPNNKILPPEWLVPATQDGQIMTRTYIDLFKTNPQALAKKIDAMVKKDLMQDKLQAFDLAFKEYAPSSLIERYNKIW